MFDIGAAELLVIVVVAILVIGPKDMPKAMRTAGRWIGKLRRMSSHFRAGLDEMVRQAEILADLGMPHAIGMRHATPHFAHVFAGDGYSSGYYSYMWSEVMDADAFDAFLEAGDAFDPETARKLEAHILSVGGSEEADALYTAFRGRMPGPEALLKGRGLAA